MMPPERLHLWINRTVNDISEKHGYSLFPLISFIYFVPEFSAKKNVYLLK